MIVVGKFVSGYSGVEGRIGQAPPTAGPKHLINPLK